jgi:hypothetical protein
MGAIFVIIIVTPSGYIVDQQYFWSWTFFDLACVVNAARLRPALSGGGV